MLFKIESVDAAKRAAFDELMGTLARDHRPVCDFLERHPVEEFTWNSQVCHFDAEALGQCSSRLTESRIQLFDGTRMLDPPERWRVGQTHCVVMAEKPGLPRMAAVLLHEIGHHAERFLGPEARSTLLRLPQKKIGVTKLARTTFMEHWAESFVANRLRRESLPEVMRRLIDDCLT